jgi:hypothetical protein
MVDANDDQPTITSFSTVSRKALEYPSGIFSRINGTQ